MGGASEALSDAFTVASNPASLARQRNRTLAVEARQNSHDTEYLTGGTIGSFTTGTFDTTSRGLRSAIFVAPLANGSWALYYDEPLNVTADATRIPRTNVMIRVGFRGDDLIPDSECDPLARKTSAATSSPGSSRTTAR